MQKIATPGKEKWQCLLVAVKNTIRTMKTIGINGFGRIGRLVFRAIVERGLLGKDVAVVALNDLVPADNLAYFVKYDSTQGRFQAKVSSAKSRPDLHEDDTLVVNGHRIKCLAVREGPATLPWEELGCEIVIESTGLYTDAKMAKGHLVAGAKKVIITAPAKHEDITIVMGASTCKRSQSDFTRSFRPSEGQTEPEIFTETGCRSVGPDDSAPGRFFARGDRSERRSTFQSLARRFW